MRFRQFVMLSLLFLLHYSGFSQANLELVAHLPYDTIVNNCWGYTHPDGTEYALVGTSTGLSIVSLEVPESPVEIHRISEPYALWRDIFTYNNFAYAVADQFVSKNGVLILDLSPLPGMPTVSTWRPYFEEFSDSLNRCHNLSIDDNGLLYLSGCNVNNGGILIADLTDPWLPDYIGPAEFTYSHDSHVVDQTLFSSNIQEGVFSVIDISDPFQPELLAQQATPGAFTHNTWTSDNKQFLFTTDEKPNAPVTSYDISDLDNIRELDQYRPFESLGLGVIPHNVQVINDYIVVSYYVEGCIILDASRPHNLIEVARYDTYPGPETGFRGAWGAYMWYPSGLIIVSDITEGLFVLQPTYLRACYLEGKVTDAGNGSNISGAEITLEAVQPNQAYTNLLGNYATGLARAGSYKITVKKAGYEPFQLENIQLSNGQLTTLNIELTALPVFNVEGTIRDKETLNPIPFAWITLTDGELHYRTQSNAEGYYELQDVFLGTYELLAANWGHLYFIQNTFSLDDHTSLDIFLSQGYQDLFEFDLGWTVSGDAEEGIWERAQPDETLTGSGRISNPGFDSPDDIGNECFVTGNGPGSVSADEVDNTTILTSPPIKLTEFVLPILEFDLWFFNAWTDIAPDDSLRVYAVTNNNRQPVFSWKQSESFWQTGLQIDLSAFANEEIQIEFEVSDYPTNENLLEAGLDNIRVIDGTSFQNPEIQRDEFALDAQPNPVSDELTIFYQISAPDAQKRIEIHDISGRLIWYEDLSFSSGQLLLPVNTFASGVYFISLLSDGKRSPAKKFIKAGT
ncbi:MAG: choice-of-anchor B family protein [Saprospiraceae bacterium]|nr:choice-of-anchor B family protein [Saprospiraceae bacterium]